MSANGVTPPAEPPAADVDAVRADIERTRAELAETVDQLTAKLDVKSRAADSVTAAKDRTVELAARAKAAAPAPVQAALGSAGDKVAPVAHQAAGPYRNKILAAVLAAGTMYLVLRRRGGDGS